MFLLDLKFAKFIFKDPLSSLMEIGQDKFIFDKQCSEKEI
jgi:hypothetical protein